MAKRILSVIQTNGTFQYLEFEQQAAGFFPHVPPAGVTRESLMTACRNASEIYINSAFPSALYARELFPKVAKRYLYDLVGQNAHEKLHIPERLWVEFKYLKDVVDTGITKQQVSYISLREEEALAIWNEFKKFQGKIKHIAPLPVALASIISNIDKPAKNVMIVWVGETQTVMCISSPDGVVHVARSVPVNLSRGDLPADPEFLSQFSGNIGKEIETTATFFKQELREPVPEILYLIGNSHLENIFQKHPLAGTSFDLHFGLSSPPVQGMSDKQINENIHLIGNLYLPREFNFIPHKAIFTRKLDWALKLSYAVLGVLVVLAVLWGAQISADNSRKLEEFNKTFSSLHGLQNEIQILRNDVARFKPLEGWKLFYEKTFRNQPRWNMILSEIAHLVSSDIVIANFRALPDKNEWRSKITGKVRADNWGMGLKLLREFGGKLESSPFFEVVNLQYAPESMETETTTFGFQMDLKLTTEESVHEG